MEAHVKHFDFDGITDEFFRAIRKNDDLNEI